MDPVLWIWRRCRPPFAGRQHRAWGPSWGRLRALELLPRCDRDGGQRNLGFGRQTHATGMRTLMRIAWLLLLCAFNAAAAQAQTYDLLITGGMVIDGTG